MRRQLLMQHRGEWDLAELDPRVDRLRGDVARRDEPLSWAAHATPWRILEEYADHVCYHRRLGGVRPLPLPHEPIGKPS